MPGLTIDVIKRDAAAPSRDVLACCLSHRADVAELADALGSGLSSRKGVEVQVLSSAPHSSVLPI